MRKGKREIPRGEKSVIRESEETALQQTGEAPVSQETPETAKKGGLSRGWKIALIVLAAVLAVVLILAVVYKSWAKLPTLPTQPVATPVADPITGEIPSQNPMTGAPRKKEFYTFLVAGRDTGGGGNTDTMMLVAYDIPNQHLAVMSLPRDTMVDAKHPDRNRKLNGVWNLGLYYAKKDNKKEGVEYLKEAVGDMMGFTPDFYVIVNWKAFGRLVDALGGVEFEVPFDMKYDDPTQDLHINVAKGKRVLTGEEAMGVVRWRHNNSYSMGYATGDLGRIQTQQAFMKEVVKKCLKIENVTKINEFAEIFTEEVETDLTMGNLVAFAERAIFGGLKIDNVVFTTMPNNPVYVGNDSYVQADPDELLGLLNDSFNPYKDDLTMDALHILQYKSSVGYYTYTGSGTGTAPTYTDPKPAQVAVSKPKPAPESEAPASSESPDPDASPASEDGEPTEAPADGEPTVSPGEGDPNASDQPEESGAPSQEETPPPDGGEDVPASAPAEEEPSTGEPPAGIPMD